VDVKSGEAFDLREVGSHFEIAGDFVSAEPFGGGHINDTFRATYRVGGKERRFVHQRINHRVFKDPAALMENVGRIVGHLRRKLAGEPDFERRAPALVPAKDGALFHRDAEGNYWRTFVAIERARTHEIVESPRQAFEAAKAFGRFQRLVTDLPAPRLRDTIPDFHNTPKRFADFEAAVKRDAAGRAKSVGREIEFAMRRQAIAGVLEDLKRRGDMPERITHNDTKFNNVVIDDATGEALCVIDLDTVMPGLALHDFGDMVRTTTSPAAEDERDLSKVELRLPMFEALVQGYLASAGDLLNEAERLNLAFAGKLITFETGLRFLADHLNGDVYFKVRREGHNLDRARTQFKLVESIERQEGELTRLVEARAASLTRR